MHVVLFYDTCRLYILHILFDPFMRLKRVGSVLSRSEIDPFFIYGIIQFGPKTGLARDKRSANEPCKNYLEIEIPEKYILEKCT